MFDRITGLFIKDKPSEIDQRKAEFTDILFGNLESETDEGKALDFANQVFSDQKVTVSEWAQIGGRLKILRGVLKNSKKKTGRHKHQR